METEIIRREFEPLQSKLRMIGKKYNFSKNNLHFYQPDWVDSELFTELLILAKKGLAKVEKYRDFFLYKEALYADGMFWYELFLWISSTSLKYKADNRQRETSEKAIESMLNILVEISRYTTAQPGDILKRNYEALGNTLFAFYSDEKRDLVLNASTEIGDERVKKFVLDTINKVTCLVHLYSNQ